MEFTGTIKGLSRDLMTGQADISFSSEDLNVESAQTFAGKKLRIAVKVYREKRSLDANAYYWQLITKLADVLRQSKPYMHNLMLRRYGQDEIVDGKMICVILPDTEKAEKEADEAEKYHLKPSTRMYEGKDGVSYRVYTMLRGSHTYDTKEMSQLINGLVDECKGVGIETLTPDELERMMSLYEKKHSSGE